MIILLNRYLGIPLESLIGTNNEIKLDQGKKEQLLKVNSIREYISKKERTAIV